MASTRLGFTRKEAGRIYLGQFIDTMEVYKRIYNFETNKYLFKIEEDEEEGIASLGDL